MSDYESLRAYTSILEDEITRLMHAHWTRFEIRDNELYIVEPVTGAARRYARSVYILTERGWSTYDTCSDLNAYMCTLLHIQDRPGERVSLRLDGVEIKVSYPGCFYVTIGNINYPISKENATKLITDIYNYHKGLGSPIPRR